MFPCTSIAGLATGCRLSASRVAPVKGTVLLCRSPCTIWILLRSEPSATMPSSRAGVVSTGRVGLVPNTIRQVANACGSRPAQDKATCPPLTPAYEITECNVIGCVITAVYNAYRVFMKNRQRYSITDNTMERQARTAFLASEEWDNRPTVCP